MIPGQRKGPLGNGDAKRWEHSNWGPSFSSARAQRRQMSWEAYPLSLDQPGQPHIVEVEYPSDVPQTLGLSVIEPNAAGAVAPIGLRFGLFCRPTTESPKCRRGLLKHRLVFGRGPSRRCC